MKYLLMPILCFSLMSCSDCRQEHFESLPITATNNQMVAVLNLHQIIENNDKFCAPEKDKSRLFTSIDNAMDSTISFDYTVKLLDFTVILAEDTDKVRTLHPGESTNEVLISRDNIDLNSAIVLFSGSDLKVE